VFIQHIKAKMLDALKQKYHISPYFHHEVTATN